MIEMIKLPRYFMQFFGVLAVSCVFAFKPFSAQAQSTTPASKSDVYGITDGRTPGGIRLVHLQIADEKDQTFQMFWRDRQVQHQPEKASLMTLAPALLVLGGAGKLDGGAIEEELNDLGGNFRMSRGRSFALAEIYAPKEQFAAVANVFSSVLNEPKLAPIVLTRRKRFLLSSRTAGREKPENFAQELMEIITVGDHPIKNTINYDPPSTISDVTIADVEAWRKSVLHRFSLTVVAAGPMTRAEAAELTDKTFASLPETGNILEAVPFTPRSLLRTIVIERKVEQSLILMGGPVRWRSGGPDGIARNFAISILGGGSSSRLFIAVREKLGAAYGASASMSSLLGQNNILMLQASVANDRLVEARAAMLAEYQKFRETGITDAEIEPLKRRMISGFENSMRKAGSAASSIRTGLLNDLSFDAPNSAVGWINSRTAEQVNKLITDRLPEKLTTILVVPSAKGLDADCIIASMEELPRCFAP
jgi:zinc protease